MFGKLLKNRSEKELRIITVIIAVILSVAMILGNMGVYERYRKNLIETEQGQLLTIARTIGTSLEQYIEQEMDKIDLCFDTLGTAEREEENADEIRKVAKMVLDGSGGLYRSCICVRNGELLFSLGEGAPAAESIAEPTAERASILGKYQADTGWYEMLIGRKVPARNGACAVVFAMDLSKVHQKIVLPVKIGSGGYSVVKDSSLAIIMHHAKNQIGMDALYDRQEKYPDLDLSSLSKWLDMQRSQEEGVGILDSYVWDDPDLKPVQRIVAYTTIDIAGERWIVNSTLPISELSGPLSRMFAVMAALTVLYLIAIGFILVAVTAALSRAEAQKKEIRYLKEINQGMEVVARKNDEIRHYQRVQSMGMMSSHIAHEFNNYLTPVMVYGELLESDATLSEDNRAMLGEMLKSVDQAAKLSRDLLDFSRMDAGGRMTVLNLTREAQEAVSIVRQLAPARISFSADLSDSPAWIKGREGMMQHILMNLCKNAFHAMEDSPVKELHIVYAVGPEAVSDAETETAYRALLTVSDTGCGIKEGNARNIFEPFYTTKGSSQGTGLGLSVVRTMVENAGGTITVESEEGKGTTFIMRFPAAETREKLGGESGLHGESADKGAKRILCVCRDKKTLKPWEAWLDSLTDGQRNEIRYTSHEAAVVARLQEDKNFCDWLVIENELEIMSGIDLAQIVKRGNAGIRVTLLTRENSAQQKWYLDNGILDEIRVPGS